MPVKLRPQVVQRHQLDMAIETPHINLSRKDRSEGRANVLGCAGGGSFAVPPDEKPRHALIAIDIGTVIQITRRGRLVGDQRPSVHPDSISEGWGLRGLLDGRFFLEVFSRVAIGSGAGWTSAMLLVINDGRALSFGFTSTIMRSIPS